MVFPNKGITMSYRSSENHSFDVKLAKDVGSVDLAILIHHFQHWINFNKRLKRNFKEGKTWSFQTRQEIAAHFPYWSPDQVRRYTDKLCDIGILEKGNFNKNSNDHTIWYAFLNEEFFINNDEGDSEEISPGKSAKSPGKSASPAGKSASAIPHTKQDTKQHVVVVSENQKNFSKDDAYFGANKFQKDWTSEEIEQAYQIFKDSKFSISAPFEYLEGIINKQRITQKIRNESCCKQTDLKNYSQKQAKIVKTQSSREQGLSGKLGTSVNATKKHPSLVYDSTDPTQISLLDLLKGTRTF